ncbi:unnamed protein product, partial [Urochloa humidicola]
SPAPSLLSLSLSLPPLSRPRRRSFRSPAPSPPLPQPEPQTLPGLSSWPHHHRGLPRGHRGSMASSHGAQHRIRARKGIGDGGATHSSILLCVEKCTWSVAQNQTCSYPRPPNVEKTKLRLLDCRCRHKDKEGKAENADSMHPTMADLCLRMYPFLNILMLMMRPLRLQVDCSKGDHHTCSEPWLVI